MNSSTGGGCSGSPKRHSRNQRLFSCSWPAFARWCAGRLLPCFRAGTSTCHRTKTRRDHASAQSRLNRLPADVEGPIVRVFVDRGLGGEYHLAQLDRGRCARLPSGQPLPRPQTRSDRCRVEPLRPLAPRQRLRRRAAWASPLTHAQPKAMSASAGPRRFARLGNYLAFSIRPISCVCREYPIKSTSQHSLRC